MHSIARRSLAATVATAGRAARATPTATRLMSTMHDNDPALLEREKRRNLAGTQHETSTPHKSHAPGWNEHLASESEAHVKADKSTANVEEIVKTTVEYVKRRHPENGGPQSYSNKEEIEGPLRDAVNGGSSKDGVKGPLRNALGSSEFVDGAEMTGSEESVRADRSNPPK